MLEYKIEIKNEGTQDDWNVYLTILKAQGFENGFKFKASNGITIIKSNEISLNTYAIFFDNSKDEEQRECIIFPNAAIGSMYLKAYKKALEELAESLKDEHKAKELGKPKQNTAIDLGSLFDLSIWENYSNLFILRNNKVTVNKNLLAGLISMCSTNYYITSQYLKEIELLDESKFIEEIFNNGTYKN